MKALSLIRLLRRSPDCQGTVKPPDSVPEPCSATTAEKSKTEQKHDVTTPPSQCVFFQCLDHVSRQRERVYNTGTALTRGRQKKREKQSRVASVIASVIPTACTTVGETVGSNSLSRSLTCKTSRLHQSGHNPSHAFLSCQQSCPHSPIQLTMSAKQKKRVHWTIFVAHVPPSSKSSKFCATKGITK